MRLLVTGICGFAGSSLVKRWARDGAGHQIIGVDNFSRSGSHTNREELRRLGVQVLHADIRTPSDLAALQTVDFVIDTAAQPSVLAGVDGRTSSRQVVEHNLLGTLNILEFCRSHGAGLILLSTSRVYSISELSALPLQVRDGAFTLDGAAALSSDVSEAGLRESFSSRSPLSLYGATKHASETLAAEYGSCFGIPVWVNRCGVLAGAGQFGHAEQGIFSYWLHSWRNARSLRYIGFNGSGHQVRDILHPDDLGWAIDRQLALGQIGGGGPMNLGGGALSALSLWQVSRWCQGRWGVNQVNAETAPRSYDVPWLVLDCAKAEHVLGFRPSRGALDILEEIATFADSHPEWLSLSAE